MVVIGKIALNSILNSSERQGLEVCLLEDAKDYYQAALVSLVDGLRSISSGFYSWSTVKLYYSVFYALRARLAIEGECIFYDAGKPRYVNVSPGCLVRKLAGTTHKCVLDRFAISFPHDYFLSQEIATKDPLTWLMEKREEVNYRVPRFSEPDAPSHLKFAANTSLRLMLGAYQTEDVYIFDQDHAIIAFPFRLMLDVRSRLHRLGISPLRILEIEFLLECTKDRSGLITAMGPLFS
jgi:uncharacterized protein (UPF0332 family)